MAEAIDDLFVRLGLETDKKQFDEAKSAFGSLRTTALQFGAAIGTGFGFRELTSGFSSAVEEMTRFGEVFSVAPEFIDQLGFAFRSTGGQAEDAFSSIRGVAQLIEDTEWGSIPNDAFRELGVDPLLLQGVESIAEAYERIMGATDGLDPETARRFFSAIGLSESDLRLAQGTGSESFQSLMQDAGDRARLTEEMQEAARAYDQATADLARSMEGISRELSSLFVGDLAVNIGNLADFMTTNRDAMVEFVDQAIPLLKDAATGIGILVGLQVARAGLGALGYVPGSALLAAGIGVGVGALARSDIDNQASEEQVDRRDQARLDQLNDFINVIDNLEGDPTDEMRERREIFEAERDDIRDRLGIDDLSMGPDAQRMSRGDTNLEFNIDARGSTDPQATAQAVERSIDMALSRAAENTLLDIRGVVS